MTVEGNSSPPAVRRPDWAPARGSPRSRSGARWTEGVARSAGSRDFTVAAGQSSCRSSPSAERAEEASWSEVGNAGGAKWRRRPRVRSGKRRWCEVVGRHRGVKWGTSTWREVATSAWSVVETARGAQRGGHGGALWGRHGGGKRRSPHGCLASRPGRGWARAAGRSLAVRPECTQPDADRRRAASAFRGRRGLQRPRSSLRRFHLSS